VKRIIFGEAIPNLFGGRKLTIRIDSQIVTFVGPNGSGKSQVLRVLKNHLQQSVGNTLYFPAGRLRPLETGRAIFNPALGLDAREADLSIDEKHRTKWYAFETVQGILNRLYDRVDLKIKVTERLRLLFNREIILTGERGHLRLAFETKKARYSSSKEASGLLHLVAILTALYDANLRAILIDEPEISLHPQLQSFLRSEMEKAAGDPELGKKIIVLATHSPSFVRLKQALDLPHFVFFTNIESLPIQLNEDTEVLKSQLLRSSIRTIGASHREAFFSERPLIVEGPSDELVLNALDVAVGTNIHAAGSHILPVIGAPNIAPAANLLRLIGKRPAIFTDLDTVIDDLDLVNALNTIPEGRTAAELRGHESVHAAVRAAHNKLGLAADKHWHSIEGIAVQHSYYRCPIVPQPDDPLRRKRSIAATVLSSSDETIASWSDPDFWISLKRILACGLEILECAGCFVNRKGTIEDNYKAATANEDNKNVAAELESLSIIDDPASAALRHDVAIRALRHVAQVPRIDEAGALIKAFLSVVAPALDELRRNPLAESVDFRAAAERHAREASSLFSLRRVQSHGEACIEVSLNATNLDVAGFPIMIRRDDNINAVASGRIVPKINGE
jgi:hypothetical protein